MSNESFQGVLDLVGVLDPAESVDRNIIFKYFKYNNDTSKGVVVVATYMYKDMPDNSSLRYGISFCSPDDRYSKQLGRDLAATRLITRDPRFFSTIKYVRYKNNKSITGQIRSDIMNNIDYPKWALKIIFGLLIS